MSGRIEKLIVLAKSPNNAGRGEPSKAKMLITIPMIRKMLIPLIKPKSSYMEGAGAEL